MKTGLPRFKRFTWKLSWKLTLIYAVLFSLVLILLNASILYGVKYFLIQQSINQVKRSSAVTVKWVADTKKAHGGLTDPALLNEAQSYPEVDVRIAGTDGRIVNASAYYNGSSLDITTDPGVARRVEIGEKHLIVENTGVEYNGRTIAYVQIIRNMAKEYAFIHLLFIMMGVADLAGILISVFAGYIISRRILRPIDKITRTAKNISVSDLNSRIDVNSADDELTRLAVTFNEMLSRLKASFELQDKFVSDASHELRTPISVIQGYINLMDRWGKDDRTVLQESIIAIKNETAGMSELVEKLLFLARGDGSKLALQKENIDLYDLIGEIIKESRFISPDHSFSYKISGEPVIYAERKMIKQMIRALIDNSIKFTPKQGKISILADVKRDRADITVEDTGVGIPENETEKIFQRFYKVDQSRSQETGGSGLGLAIVKGIVDAHSGSIVIKSAPNAGTSITVTLPQN